LEASTQVWRIYTYGSGVSDYTCHPNIHYLLYGIKITSKEWLIRAKKNIGEIFLPFLP